MIVNNISNHSSLVTM